MANRGAKNRKDAETPCEGYICRLADACSFYFTDHKLARDILIYGVNPLKFLNYNSAFLVRYSFLKVPVQGFTVQRLEIISPRSLRPLRLCVKIRVENKRRDAEVRRGYEL